jgi:hypothetical protein
MVPFLISKSSPISRLLVKNRTTFAAAADRCQPP